MRAVLQRVKKASVDVDGRQVGAIGAGLLVFFGVGRVDARDVEATDLQLERLAQKVVELRVFPDSDRAMNLSLRDIGGEILLVSQFTLYADCRRGRRPSFDPAGAPVEAEALYKRFAAALADLGFPPAEGVFGAHMRVRLENDGPVTILLDSEDLFAGRARRATEK